MCRQNASRGMAIGAILQLFFPRVAPQNNSHSGERKSRSNAFKNVLLLNAKTFLDPSGPTCPTKFIHRVRQFVPKAKLVRNPVQPPVLTSRFACVCNCDSFAICLRFVCILLNASLPSWSPANTPAISRPLSTVTPCSSV